MLVLATLLLAPATLRVGDGYPIARIEDAVAAAHGGETIEVHPSGQGYSKTAVLIDKPSLTVKAFGRIVLDGGGFAYSGAGRTPRAIFQVDPSGSGAEIDGFELTGAHNGSFNGAGVRINGANDVSVRRCDIHGNDMGIMSNNVPGKLGTGRHQLIDGCRIHENGSPRDPGQNHNLYLGGDSVWIYWCHIFGALTGHNVKTRAHRTVITDSIVYGGNNRQIDAVESEETEQPASDVQLFRDLIVMNPRATGNRNVIHFGQERGKRWGQLNLAEDMIVTNFAGPVFLLDSPGVTALVETTCIFNPDQQRPQLISAGSKVAAGSFVVQDDWISSSYSLESPTIRQQRNLREGRRADANGFEAEGGRAMPMALGMESRLPHVGPTRVRNPWKQETKDKRKFDQPPWWLKEWGASPKGAMEGL